MKTTLFAKSVIMVGTAGVLWMTVALCAEPSADPAEHAKNSDRSDPAARAEGGLRVSVSVARDRAKVMHEIYTATLEMLHERYFHRDRAILPARAMEDVFAEMKKQSNVKTQWISVNTKAMNIDHEPKSDFEKKAATEIAAGKSEVEAVEGGYYRRAGVIPLASGCTSCHVGFFRDSNNSLKFAGLVISVPVASGSEESK